jgi:hypothetical protein
MLHTVWDETAFRWDICHITCGSHIEHLRTKTVMLGHCCGAIYFPICDFNKKSCLLNCTLTCGHSVLVTPEQQIPLFNDVDGHDDRMTEKE